jgi:hypothetical protein
VTELYYFFDPRDKACTVGERVAAVAAALELPMQSLSARDAPAGRLVLAFGLLDIPAVVVVRDKHYVATIDGADLRNAVRLERRIARLIA